MSNVPEGLDKDRETLKESIEILIASIEAEQQRRGIQKNINNDVNTKFLENLRSIEKSLNDKKKSIDPKGIREGIERLTGGYLVALRDSKPANQSDTEYKKGLEAVQVGIGKALLVIEKVKLDKPKAESTNWFVKNFRNLQGKIGDFILGRQTMQLQFARYKAIISGKTTAGTSATAGTVVTADTSNSSLGKIADKIEHFNKYLTDLGPDGRFVALTLQGPEVHRETMNMYSSRRKICDTLPEKF